MPTREREPLRDCKHCGQKVIWWGVWAHNLPKFDKDHKAEPVTP